MGAQRGLGVEGCSEPPSDIAQEKGGPTQRHEAARPGPIMRERRRDGEQDADHEDQRGRSRAEPHRMRLRPSRAEGGPNNVDGGPS